MSFVYLTEDDLKVQKRGGRYVIGRHHEVLFEIPEEILESLVLIGKIQISSQAMQDLLKQGVPVTFLSHRGEYFGRLESTKNVDVFRQQKQILLQGSPLYFELAKKIIKAKVHNQIILLRRYNRYMKIEAVTSLIMTMEILAKKLPQAKDSEQLMGYEGLIAKNYFLALGFFMPEGWKFWGRSRRPPKNPFNAMLSFGYTILLYEMYTPLVNRGLNPYFGFFHKLKNHHPALASDLMEEWRAILIDSMAISLIHHKEILPEHFYHQEDGGVYLQGEGRRIFLKAYEKKLRTQNKYLGQELSYRQSLVHQTGGFVRAIMEDNSDFYQPIILR